MNYLFLSPRGPALFPRPSFRWSGVGLESVPFGSGLTTRFIDLKKLTLEHSFINDSCTTSLSIVILSMFSAFPFFSGKALQNYNLFLIPPNFRKTFFEFVFCAAVSSAAAPGRDTVVSFSVCGCKITTLLLRHQIFFKEISPPRELKSVREVFSCLNHRKLQTKII